MWCVNLDDDDDDDDNEDDYWTAHTHTDFLKNNQQMDFHHTLPLARSPCLSLSEQTAGSGLSNEHTLTLNRIHLGSI